MKLPKKRIERFSIIISAFLFIINGYLFFKEGNILLGVVTSIIGVGNLIAIRFLSKNSVLAYLILNIFNFVAALGVAYDFMCKHTKALHFAWMFVAFMYLVVSIIFAVKLKKNRQIE